MEEAVVLLQGLKGTLCAKPAKGKQQDASALSAGLQEALSILNSFQQASDVVLPAMSLLENVLVSCPQAATILRLEGGLKLLPRLLRSCLADEPVLSACGRVLARCASSSTVNQQLLAKEKGISAALLAALTAHSRSASVVPPLVELLVGISRTARGAQSLAGEAMVQLARDLLVNFMGNWAVFGCVIKALKLQAKHEGCAECLMRVNNGEVSRMLLAVARLLARIPAQHTTLKRTSRTLWLLHRSALPPLPDLELLVPLPARDAPHLSLVAAPDCTDTARLMDLVPEEFSAELLQAAAASSRPPVGPPTSPPTTPPADPSTSNPAPPAPSTVASTDAQTPSTARLGMSTSASGVASTGAVRGMPESSNSSGAVSKPMVGAALEATSGRRPASRGQYAAYAQQAHMVRASPARCGSTSSSTVQHHTVCDQLQGIPQERTPACRPPTAAQLTAAALQQQAHAPEPFHDCGPAYETDMMMHDLRRLVHPEAVRSTQVYCSVAAQQQRSQQEAQPASAQGTAGAAIEHTSGLQPTGAVSRALASLQLADAHHGTKATARAAEQSGAAYGDLLLRTAVRNGEVLTSAAAAVNIASSPAHGGSVDACHVPPLVFDSLFESGNLRAAYQVYGNEYDLFLAPDLNARNEGGNLCQWFYFSVTGMQRGVAYKFNLVNLCKKQSLFAVGKRPLMWHAGSSSTPAREHAQSQSQQHRQHDSMATGHQVAPQGQGDHAAVVCTAAGGWVRAGASVTYYPSPYRGRSTQPSTGGAHMQARRTSSKKVEAVSLKKGKLGITHEVPAQRGKRSTGTGQPSAPFMTAGSQAGRDTVASSKQEAAGEQGAAVGPGLYCITFTLVFPEPGTYYLASCYPYTYTDLQDHLDGLTARLSYAAQPHTPQHELPAATTQAADALQGAGTDSNSNSSHNAALHAPNLTASRSTPNSRPSSRPECGPAPKPVRLLSPNGTTPTVVLSGGIMARSLLCYSLAGHATELITITDFSASAESVISREVVAITARVHPGETCASWIMQGILDFLTSNDPDACMLRSSFVFKLVPMLNPDGVVNGSYRCSLAGCDLNRVWEKPACDTHPTIHHTKRLLQALASNGVGLLALYVDIHGHSNKEDVFFYGCEPNLSMIPSSSAGTSSTVNSSLMLTKQQLKMAAASCTDHDMQTTGSQGGFNGQALPAMGSSTSGVASNGNTSSSVPGKVAARLRVRMLPYLLHQINPSCWNLGRCNFRIRKAKLGAARVVVHRELGCSGAYTLEASLGGRSADRSHFTLSDYLNMGTELCRGIAQLAQVDDAALLEEMMANITLPTYNMSSYAA